MSLSPALDFSPEYNMAAVNRKLESEFISIQDKNMCVYARVRPLLQKEEESGYNACIGVIDEETVRAVVPPNSLKYRTRNQDIIEDFKYTAAFGPEIGQFVFFEETMCNPMQDFIEGKNSLIFSYGITGSGKTYTFQGDEENPGIITLALRLFFASIEHQLSNRIFFKPDKFADINHLSDEEIEKEQKLKEQLLSMQRESGNLTGCSTTAKKSFAMSLCEAFSDNFKFEERETTLPFEEMSAAQSAMQMKELCKKCADKQSGSCTVWVSFVEIYNENVYDLLQPNINLRTRLTLGEDKNGDVYIKGLREVCISNYEEALGLLDLGRKTLKIASTKLNYQSSRSHCIYTIKVVRLIDEDNMTVRINRLAFCDLAGSERASKAQTTGLRLKEAGCINTSLLVLGRCLEQLRANQNLKDKRLIPFRESKLTRLFSGFFLGKGSAVMIANASPCDYTFDETLNVLKFSALAKELMINDSYMSMASSSLQSISNQWAKARQRISDASEGNQTIDMDYTAEEIQEKDELIEKLLDLADSLRQNLEKECKEKAELEFKIRQEVCNEYSEYSDGLLENQRRIFEEEKSSIIDIHKKRIGALEEMYEREIKNYKQQIEEYEAILDESRNTSVNTEINTSTAQIFTDTSFTAADDHDKKENISKSEICHAEPLCSESSSALLKQYIEKNKNLEKEMNSLKEKLELAEMELQKTVLKEEMNTEVKYSEYIKKLEESASITEEYKEEINLLKESCSSYASKIKRLQEEKMILEDDVSSLSAQLASASLELEKLRQEKEELEKMLASTSEDVLKYKMQEDENAALQQKLLESSETIEQNRNEITRLLNENNDLKENISSLTDLLVATNVSMEEIKSAKTETEEELARSLKNHQKKEADLQTKCDNLNIQLKQAVAALEEESNKVMELKKSEASSIRNQDVLNLKLQNALEDLEKEKNKISEIKRESVGKEDYHRLNIELQNMIQKLENSQQIIDELRKNEANLNEKCSELDLKLHASILSLEEEKYKFNELKKEDSVAKEQFCELEKKLKEAELTLEDKRRETDELIKDHAKTKAEIEELHSQLRIANESLKGQKDQIEILGKEKSILEGNILKLEENLQEAVQTSTQEKEKTADLRKSTLTLEEKCEEIGKLQTEIDKLKQENSTLEGNIHELEQNLQAAQISEEEKAKGLRENAAILEEKCKEVGNLKTEIDKLKLEKRTLEGKLHELQQNHQEAIEALAVEKKNVAELEKSAAALEEKCEELEDLKTEMDKLKQGATALEEKCEQIEKLKAEVDKLKQEKVTVEEKVCELQQNHQEAIEALVVEKEKADELEKKKSTLEGIIHKLEQNLEEAVRISTSEKEKADDLRKSVAAFEGKCKEVESLKTEMDKLKQGAAVLEGKCKEVENLKTEIDQLKQEKSSLEGKFHELQQNYQEAVEALAIEKSTSHQLICVLEQCENTASLKIKEFHSNCIKHLEELTDLRRQVNEKNSSIEDMEKALCASQQQIKELTSKFTKQLSAEKDQHFIEIEKLVHLKQIIEKENTALKLKISQEEDAGSNKRPISSEEENKKSSRNSQKTDKENYTEAKNTRKTRRVLAEKQGNAKSNIDNENNLSSDEDFESAKVTQTKKISDTAKLSSKIPRKRKQEDEEFKVPIKRTSRKKLQEIEQENSPVRKIANAFNSKVRNLAQNVAAFSPRLTRGRKRLFNPETALSSFASQSRK